MKPDIKKYDFFIFDCDGVILDSNSIKSDAFYKVGKMFSEEAANSLLSYHLSNQGISRFEKFKVLLKDFASVDNFDKEYNRCLNSYQEILDKDILEAPITKSFIEFIEINKKKSFVISGTPETELQKVLKHKDLDQYFIEILGSPTNKQNNLEKLLREHSLLAPNSLFFGDARVDYETAHNNGIDFCYVSDYSQMSKKEEFFKDKAYFEIKNFSDLVESI